jgi:hypothetical protein
VQEVVQEFMKLVLATANEDLRKFKNEHETATHPEILEAIERIGNTEVGDSFKWSSKHRMVESIGVDAHQGQLAGLRKYMGKDFERLGAECQTHFQRALYASAHADAVPSDKYRQLRHILEEVLDPHAKYNLTKTQCDDKLNEIRAMGRNKKKSNLAGTLNFYQKPAHAPILFKAYKPDDVSDDDWVNRQHTTNPKESKHAQDKRICGMGVEMVSCVKAMRGLDAASWIDVLEALRSPANSLWKRNYYRPRARDFNSHARRQKRTRDAQVACPFHARAF